MILTTPSDEYVVAMDKLMEPLGVEVVGMLQYTWQYWRTSDSTSDVHIDLSAIDPKKAVEHALKLIHESGQKTGRQQIQRELRCLIMDEENN